MSGNTQVNGGIGSGGNINMSGARNQVSSFSQTPIDGGDSGASNPFFVFDGAPSSGGPNTNGATAPPTSRGTGGGGANSSGNPTPRSGGAGSGGLVIVEEFY
jgi:hypothetical protein